MEARQRQSYQQQQQLQQLHSHLTEALQQPMLGSRLPSLLEAPQLSWDSQSAPSVVDEQPYSWGHGQQSEAGMAARFQGRVRDTTRVSRDSRESDLTPWDSSGPSFVDGDLAWPAQTGIASYPVIVETEAEVSSVNQRLQGMKLGQ